MTDSLRVCPLTATAICVIGFLLAAVITPTAVAGAAAQPPLPETDNTVTRIHVSPNGSAQWTIQIRTRLDTDDRVAEYEAFQARFRDDTARYLDPFRERMRGVVANAANATGREMRAVNVTASTRIQEVPRRWGIVTYQFTWTHFAVQQNETLVVGDIFQGGFFLAANDTLEVEAPAGYEIARVEPTPTSWDDGGVTWIGREDFASEHPRVVFTATGQDATAGGERTSTQLSTTNGATTSPLGDIGPGFLVGGTLLLGLVSIGAYTVLHRRDGPNATEQAVTGSLATDSTAAAQAPTSEAAPSGEPATGPEVMTDTERVQTLLEANDGRMRQAAIADEFDWSASKASRVIGKLVDEGTIEKRQLGRENLIDLADNDE
ncbi:helix-turn-helix transcriptional regulator [Halomarina halobia]|uniref:Helix-turn-helix transcriptional regulator n=1 Tax=Halomarina halobia TaxID=3033386 RepID=A0ABD6ABT7_9EURY|nr:hypothetical protein [Halomarina sp. PSR21]